MQLESVLSIVYISLFFVCAVFILWPFSIKFERYKIRDDLVRLGQTISN